MNNLFNSNIPYTQITKEVWVSITRTLENEQIGELMVAFAEYVYTGKIPKFNGRVMNGQWDLLIEKTEDMSQSYFKKVANAKESARKRMANKNSSVTNKNPPNDISNQATKNNGSESLKMTNTREIPNEFAIPIPEVNEPVVDEGEIDDTGEFYYEWETECERLLKDAMIETLDGNGYAMRECNNKLQNIYNVFVANGCSEDLLTQIKDSVRERVSNEVEKEYNEKVA